MPVLDKAPQPIIDFVADVVERFHPQLLSAGVRIDVMVALPTEREIDNDLPPLKLRGEPAAAIARIIPLKYRIKGCGDCEITICSQTWGTLDEEERTALVDHESMHFQLAKDKDGGLKYDAAGRPVIKTRLHDIVVGGFRSVIARHGLKALEAQHLKGYFGEYRQKLFSWSDDQAPQDECPDIAGVVRAAV